MLKQERQQLILRLIKGGNISRQETLRKLLAENGARVTQATLSRDMRELGIKKVSGKNKAAVYYADENKKYEFPAFVRESVLSVDHSGNIVVFRCNEGSAQAVCAVFDREDCFGAVGTIAGDDTIFMLMRSEQDAKRTAESLSIK